MEVKPNLIIAGVTKGGTTSIFSYLSHHPDICTSSIKETCYFLPLRYGNEIAPISEYTKYFKHYKNEKYRVEATPGYFYGNKFIPQKIYETLGKVKILIVLREPISRLFSFYKALKTRILISKDMTFDEYIEMCKNYMEPPKDRETDTIYRGVREGLYSNYFGEWYNYFGDSLKVTFFEYLQENPLLLMHDLCDWLEIDPSIYSTQQFTIENKSVLYKNKSMHKLGLYINKNLESLFRKLPKMKLVLRNIYYGVNESSMNERISREIHTLLESIYAPYNKILFNMLKENNQKNFPGWLYCNGK
ncbi:MAG: sulfotransferase domain-containing protein [Candidatus Brocadiaceae bacterium]